MVLLTQVMRLRSWSLIGIQISLEKRLASFLVTEISFVAQSRGRFAGQISDIKFTARPLPACGSPRAISRGIVRLAFGIFGRGVNPREQTIISGLALNLGFIITSYRQSIETIGYFRQRGF
jgi:hypothetical protein